MQHYFKLIRIHHYLKNLLVFAALACSGQLLVLEKAKIGTIGFVSFCFISSVVYITNDIKDKEKDKKHPEKCKRPIAAGYVSVNKAIVLAVILFILSCALNCLVFNIYSTILLFLYFALNVVYSFGGKNIPILDVTILVSGFLIRILYGAIVTNIAVSNWLYLTVIVLAFYFALGKRRNELKYSKDGSTRAVLRLYSEAFLDKSMVMCMTLALAFYALWSMDEKTVSFYNSPYLVLTVPLVLLIVLRYSFNIEGDSDGDPTEVLLHDKVLMTLCFVYFAIMFTILYL